MKGIKAVFQILIFLLFCSDVHSAYAETGKSLEKIRLFGFTQLWAQYDNTQGANHGEAYNIARARIGIKGNLSQNTNYMLLTEWGRLTYDDPCTLLDAWVNFRLNPALNIKIGQTWYKFSLSGTTPIPEIPFVYRPEVIDGMWLTMGRNGSYSYDRGIELWGSSLDSKLPFGYIFSVTAGSGLDHFEDNKEKDFTGRVWVEPLKNLRIGASNFCGWSRTEIKSNLGNDIKKDLPEYAGGLELSYSRARYRFISEYLRGLYEGYLDVTGAEVFQIAGKKPRGWYTMFGVKVLPRMEVLAQYAWYEKDFSVSNTGLETITLGLTWWLKENTLNNIKFNYLIRDAEESYGSNPRDMVALQVQLAF